MQLDDMILVSIDDHMIEPPDMYKNHVPAKWLDQAPKVVRNDAGRRRVGLPGRGDRRRRSAWPPPSAGRARSGASTPAPTPSCGPGCFDVHERVRDMNANGVLASMSFPTMAGFNARTFTEARRQGGRARHAAGLQRLGHRRVVRRLPGPLHPARHRPDVGRRPRRRGGAPDRPRRAAGRSASSRRRTCRASRASCRATGTRCCRRSCDENMVLSLHIGAGFDVIQQRRGGAGRPPDGAGLPDQRDHRAGPALRPDAAARSRTSRSRCPRAGSAGSPSTSTASTGTSRTRRGCTQDDFGGKLPSEVFREHILACYITDPSGPAAARPDRHRHHRLGVRLPAHRHDVARVARVRLEGVPGRRLHRRRDPQDHLGERLPVLRLGPVRAHAEGAGDGRRAARAGHATSTPPACRARSGASATRPPASASSVAPWLTPTLRPSFWSKASATSWPLKRWPEGLGATWRPRYSRCANGRGDEFPAAPRVLRPAWARRRAGGTGGRGRSPVLPARTRGGGIRDRRPRGRRGRPGAARFLRVRKGFGG